MPRGGQSLRNALVAASSRPARRSPAKHIEPPALITRPAHHFGSLQKRQRRAALPNLRHRRHLPTRVEPKVPGFFGNAYVVSAASTDVETCANNGIRCRSPVVFLSGRFCSSGRPFPLLLFATAGSPITTFESLGRRCSSPRLKQSSLGDVTMRVREAKARVCPEGIAQEYRYLRENARLGRLLRWGMNPFHGCARPPPPLDDSNSACRPLSPLAPRTAASLPRPSCTCFPQC